MRSIKYLMPLVFIFCAVVSGQDWMVDSFLADSLSASDTLWLDSLATHSGEQVVCNIYLVNPDSLNGVDLPLRYEYSDFRIDSVSFAGGRVDNLFSNGFYIDSLQATLHIHALELNGVSLAPGRGLLARIFITVPNEYPTRVIMFDTTFILPESRLTFVNRDNISFTPQFRPGYVNNTYSPALNDSLWLDTVDTPAGRPFVVLAHARNEMPLFGIKIPLTYHSDNIVLDSVTVTGTRASEAVLNDVLIHEAAREALVTLGFSESALLPAGSGPVANLYFTCTIGGGSTSVVLDTTTIGAVPLHFQLGANYDHVKSYPDFVPGLVKVGPPSDADDGNGGPLPIVFALEQNQPNPFNPTTTITFALPKAGHVSLEVYNVLGQKVRTLVNDFRTAGFHSVVFDGRDGNDAELASGVYLYRIKTDTNTDARKMVLMK
ncbi:MAG: T9SS type A sorting domain-containing protein [candidate division Zixibacteria bacterium]|nr:T9SS type A sorting domain-containing protein [candidate division Zixibacteria bacterium]